MTKGPQGALCHGYGAPGEIRTPDPQVRSLILYPAELRAQKHDMNGGAIILDWDTAKKVS